MAVRIEYILLLILLVLLLSILGINPSSKEATSSKGEKEIEFENFFLHDIKENEPAQKMYAIKSTKYQHYLEMDKIDLSDESPYRLLSNKAIHEGDYVFMDSGVNILRDDGLKFTTKSLNYNLETKDVTTIKPFILEFNSSIVLGDNLELNTNNKEVRAQHVEASIFFVSKEDNTTQE